MSHQTSQDEVPDKETCPVVILARPQMGENIGACARAMKNCGLWDLRLIAPRDGWPNPAALPMATVGADIISTARVYPDLPSALSDISFMVATSARPRDMEKPVMGPTAGIAALIEAQKACVKAQRRVALLFGSERSGLDNDELALADIVAQAPLQKGASSLNLAQAVFLMGWEWRKAVLQDNFPDDVGSVEGLSVSADLAARNYFMGRLETVLDQRGFFSNRDMAPTVKRNLRNLIARARPTEQELKTLHGILTLFEREK